MFSKVLVTVDGSENSVRALNTAVFLSTRMELQLTALNVEQDPPTVLSPVSYSLSAVSKNIDEPARELQKGITNNSRKV